MDRDDIAARRGQAFARWNERMDSLEDKALPRPFSGLVELGGELAQARAMLDIIATRSSAIAPAERGDLERQVEPLRKRWRAAQEALDSAKSGIGEERARGERESRAALTEVQDGLLQLIAEMNRRFAGRGSEIAGEARDQNR